MGKYKCEMVKVEAGNNTQYQVLMNQEKCKYDLALKVSPEKCLCCQYGYDHNIYVCKFCGEEVLVNGGKETGPATMYCTFGE